MLVAHLERRIILLPSYLQPKVVYFEHVRKGLMQCLGVASTGVSAYRPSIILVSFCDLIPKCDQYYEYSLSYMLEIIHVVRMLVVLRQTYRLLLVICQCRNFWVCIE